MMKKEIYTIVVLVFALVFKVSSQVPVVAPAQKKAIILKGGTIHTGTGNVIDDGIIVFDKGKITFAGRYAEYTGDKSAFEVIDVTGKHVYPGLIFPATSLGLVEIGSGVDVAADYRETGDLNPNVRAIVAYNTDSHVIPVLRSNGILLAQIIPTGTMLPGTSSIVQLDAWNWMDAAYKADNGIQMVWPVKSVSGGWRGDAYSQSAETGQAAYEKNVETLEDIFTDAAAYATVEKPEDTNLRLEAMRGLFDGTKTLFITANETKGIMASISFGKRHGVRKMVLSEADESAWAVKDFLKENNIPVLLADPFSNPKYDYSDTKLPFRLASLFMKEGILVGLTYSNQAYGNLPFAAGQTVSYGLTKEEALQTLTLNNAKILGIDDRTGSIETGKDANIVVSTGDILDIPTNNIEYAFIAGRNITLDNKHKQLYRRFQSKYNNMPTEK